MLDCPVPRAARRSGPVRAVRSFVVELALDRAFSSIAWRVHARGGEVVLHIPDDEEHGGGGGGAEGYAP